MAETPNTKLHIISGPCRVKFGDSDYFDAWRITVANKIQNEGKKKMKGKFKIEKREVGDVVKLPSDNKTMTVVGFKLDGKEAICGWFNENGEAHQCRFPIEALLCQNDDCEWVPYGDSE